MTPKFRVDLIYSFCCIAVFFALQCFCIVDSLSSNLGFLDLAGGSLVWGGLGCESRIWRPTNLQLFALYFVLHCNSVLHCRLLKLRLMSLGIHGRWFGLGGLGMRLRGLETTSFTFVLHC